MKNEELVLHYQMGDPDVFGEILRRFTICAKKEVNILLKDNKNTDAEFEDLLSISLSSLVVALRSYAYLGSFYNYWISIATNDMMEHIRNFSNRYISREMYLSRNEADYDESGVLISSGEDIASDMSNNWFLEKIEEILSRPNEYQIKEEEAKMFILYFVNGLDYKDIATKYQQKYFTVRSKIQRVRERITFILFNSKE